MLLFRNAHVTPEQQYALTKVRSYSTHLILQTPPSASSLNLLQAFDPASETYGHGNNKTGETKKSILHPDLKTIPRVPQVQLIGNGTVYDHEGLPEVRF